MRLLYVIDSLAPGGAETSLAAMAEPLSKHGIDLHVLPLGIRRDLAPALEAGGATVHVRKEGRGGRLGNIEAVVSAARSIQPDLIHTTLFEADIAGRIAAARLRIPSSTSVVNDSYSASHYAESNHMKLHLARALDAGTARLATSFHSLSATIAHQVAPRIGLDPERFTVIPRGRDPEQFPFQPAEVRMATRDELGLRPDTKVILALGRHEPQKGFHHLLSALPAVAAIHPELTVLIAGREGRSTPTLTRQASQLHLDVRFLGARKDVAALLAAADTFCFPSEREGFGGVLIEAMAAGCPIVASDIPTSQEVLRSGPISAGALAPVGDVARLSDALATALMRGPSTEERTQIARRRFEGNYTISQVARRMAEFYSCAATEA